MVSATVAEATAYGVNIKGPGGRTIAAGSKRLADASDPHGISRDEADEEVERLGYVAGVWRWQENGSYYKAVVLPEAQARARNTRNLPPPPSPDVRRLRNINATGHPEGMAGRRREGPVSGAEVARARAELRRRGLL